MPMHPLSYAQYLLLQVKVERSLVDTILNQSLKSPPSKYMYNPQPKLNRTLNVQKPILRRSLQMTR